MTFKQALRARVPDGLWQALRQLRAEWGIARQHAVGVRWARRLAAQRGLKLQFGCGDKRKAGWVNIDLRRGADVALDLRRPLPFADGSCDRIYSEHFLEHIDYPQPALSLLGECLRVLAPGGEFSVGVPDTEWPVREYAGVSHEGYFELAKTRWHPGWCRTPMEHLNFHFRNFDDHRFAYDAQTLGQALTAVGFVEVARRDFDPELDDAGRALGTLYMRAVRP
jgi:SAM-dependent methyltransferase